MPALKRASAPAELTRLVAVYLRAETQIINEIGRLRSQGLADYHAEAALERVQAILRGLENECWQYVPQMIERQFYVRRPEARIIPETVGKHTAAYAAAQALTTEQTAIVERLVMNLMGEITQANQTAQALLRGALLGRTEPDVFRQVGLELTAQMEAAGAGVRTALPQFVETLRREGVTCFIDRAGRHWRLHAYGSMVLRTTSRQAEILSVLTADPEHDLYQISSHDTGCALCAPYEGRVYSKSGTDPVFPPLAAAFGKIDPNGPDTLENTYLNIHPNCLHVLRRWSPAGKSPEELERIRRFSDPRTNPFDRDPRTQKQIEAYRKKELGRRHWLERYRQWERYRVTLGDRVPRTFQTFEKHMLAGDEKWRLWKLDYDRQSRLLAHPELALPGASTAMAADRKFTNYFFGGDFPEGLFKGAAFSSRLGYHAGNWPLMQQEILSAAVRYPATLRGHTGYGDSFSQDVILYGLNGRPANVQIGWLVHPDGTAHFVTAHMEEI